jgi:TP901 family phage tail tape measure protein
MSEIRQLVVSLTTDTSSASQNLRGLRAVVADANAAFAEASAGVKGFENTTAGMRAKVQQLTDTLNAQKQMAAIYAAEVQKASKRLEEAKGKQESLAQAVKDAEAAYKESVRTKGKDSEETRALAEELDKARAAVVANDRAMTNAARAIQRNETQQRQANARVRETEAALEDATRRLNQYGGAWRDAMRNASEAAGVVADRALGIGRRLTTRVTMPIVGVGVAASRAAIDWDTAWVGVQKTVDGTEEQLASLREGLMDLGGELPMALDGIAGVAEAAGQLGIQQQNILDFTKTMVNLGNATNLSADAAATAAAQFANIYQMNQTDFDRWGSAVVQLGNNSATTERDIVNMAMNLAAAGKQAKLSEADTLALATALSSLGLEAAGGGSAMSKVMMDMGIAVAEGGEKLESFAKVSGMSAAAFQQAWAAEPAKAIDAFIQGLGRIERSGGNVALTLQEMGYNERRVLDALQRLTGAGDILTRSLEHARQGWSENIALTREAEQRNNSLAGVLQRTQNRITVAAIEIGEKLTPYIREAADWVAGLVEGFRNLDPAIQANILKWAGIAAAIGPAVLMIGRMARAISTVTRLMAGPAGWAVLGAAAVAALGLKLAGLKTSAEKAQEALSNIKLSIGEDSQNAITEGINKGIAAAESKKEISVLVDADTSAMVSQLNSAFADKKLTGQEYTALRDFVNEKIKPDIEAARKIIELEVADYRRTLEGAVDKDGKLLSDEEKDKLVSEFEDKLTTQVDEFEAAVGEYEKLLQTIRDQGGEATAEQIANLEAAIEKVGLLRKEIFETHDQALSVAKVDYALTIEGRGDAETLGTSLGYVMRSQALDLAAAKEARDEAKRTSQTLDEAAAIQEAYAQTVTSINARYQDMFEAIAEGVAKGNPEAEKLLATIGQLHTTMEQLNQIDDSEVGENYLKEWDKVFGAGAPLEQYVTSQLRELMDIYRKAGDADSVATAEGYAKGLVTDIKTQLAGEVQAAADDPGFQPIAELLKGMMDAKAFDIIDPTTVEGPLLDMLKLVDLKTGGQLLGEDVVEGMKLGINAGAESSLTADQLRPMQSAVVSAISSLFQIRSPSRLVEPMGRQIPAGLAQGILANKNAMVDAIRQMYRAAMLEVNRLEKLLRASMATLQGGVGGFGARPGGRQGTVNYDHSSHATVHIGQYVARNETDVNLISQQIAALNRRRVAAVGGRLTP